MHLNVGKLLALPISELEAMRCYVKAQIQEQQTTNQLQLGTPGRQMPDDLVAWQHRYDKLCLVLTDRVKWLLDDPQQPPDGNQLRVANRALSTLVEGDMVRFIGDDTVSKDFITGMVYSVVAVYDGLFHVISSVGGNVAFGFNSLSWEVTNLVR